MYYILSLLCGVTISIMVFINGGLTEQIGIFSATVFIHLTGFLVMVAAVLIRRDRLFSGRRPWYYYMGGVIGVATVIFNCYSFGRISISAIQALLLFGQSVTGLIIDQFGWMGMPKNPFNKKRMVGLALTLAGIAVMMDRFELVAVLLSFCGGITIVTSRTFNAKLSDVSNVSVGSFFNHLIGLVVSIPVMFLLGGGEQGISGFSFPSDFYIYFGGVTGVCVVIISNMTVTKIPAFYLSLLFFISQVFTGIIIDAMIDGSFSPRILAGGILVTAGLCANLILDKRGKKPSGANEIQ